MAGVTGLEPAASGVTGQRSNLLSYTPAGASAPTPLLRRVAVIYEMAWGLSIRNRPLFCRSAKRRDRRTASFRKTLKTMAEIRVVGGAGVEPATFRV